MRRSDLLLKLLSVAIAVALLLVVRGERRVTATYAVPVEARLPRGLEAAAAMPPDVSVTVTGPWARMRDLDGASLGPIVLDLSRARRGLAAWLVHPDALHVPRGVRVEGVFPAQGTVDLVPASAVEPSTSEP